MCLRDGIIQMDGHEDVKWRGEGTTVTSSTIRTLGHSSACDDKRTVDDYWHHVQHHSLGGAGAMVGDDVMTTSVSHSSFVHR